MIASSTERFERLAAAILKRAQRLEPALEMLLKIRTQAHQWLDGEQPRRNPKQALLRVHDRLKAICNQTNPRPTSE